MAALASHVVTLALGSNQGDRLAMLRAAMTELAPHVTITRCSSIYETPPWGVHDQPAFLNAALAATTRLSPAKLLRAIKQIEASLGRDPAGPRYGPRPIDIDILTYADLQIATPDLSIPHPRIAERSFVLVPLAEIAPTLTLRPGGPPIAALRDARPDRHQIRVWGRPLVAQT